MKILLFLLLVGSVSLVLTHFLRRYALANNLIDDPNHRSSHTEPTPRGGGVAIVLTFLSFMPFLGLFDLAIDNVFWALVGGGAWVAMAGFIDDHGHIDARWRLLLHFVGACWALAWLGGLPPLPIFGVMLDFGWAGHIFAAVYLVWLLNLYNFMDGIDGIAGLEAVSVCLGGLVLYLLTPASQPGWMIPMLLPILLLIAAVLGFLFWNFPKAKIFLGDAGSGFIGITLGIFSIQAAWVSPELFWAWVILLGSFITDATVTLIRRVLRNEKFYQAHRSHAYQYAARKFGGHIPVTFAFAAINLLWLLPVAAMVARGWLSGVLGLVVAYIPLIVLAIYFKAGARELQEN